MSKKVLKKIPRHIAIIMDGNRRWAAKRGMPAVAGHGYVVERVVEKLIQRAGELGVEYITFWAFSTENWSRAEEEVEGIMKLFRLALEKKAKKMIERGARLRVIGDMSRFPEDIQKGIGKMVKGSEENTAINVTFALNYGGRDELVRAVGKSIEEILRRPDLSHLIMRAQDDKNGMRSLPFLSSKKIRLAVEKNLDTAGMPDPDLVIRTGGTKRLSGFMLWQVEYAEFYFTEVLMPEFGPSELDKAVEDFSKRKRRFGGGKFEEYDGLGG